MQVPPLGCHRFFCFSLFAVRMGWYLSWVGPWCDVVPEVSIRPLRGGCTRIIGRGKSADMTGGGRLKVVARCSGVVHAPDGEPAMLTAVAMSRARYLLVSRPGLAARGEVAAVRVIQTVGLHQSWQTGIVRLVAFGAGKGVLAV